MKRTAPKRRKPLVTKARLRSGEPPRRRTYLKTRSEPLWAAEAPIRAASRPRRKTPKLRAYEAEFERAKKLVKERSRGYCEGAVSGVCTGLGQEVHHRKRRGPGGNQLCEAA